MFKIFNCSTKGPGKTSQQALIEKEIAEVKKDLTLNFYQKLYVGTTATVSTCATILYATAWFLEGSGIDNEYPTSTLSTAAVTAVSAYAFTELEIERSELASRLASLERAHKALSTGQ